MGGANDLSLPVYGNRGAEQPSTGPRDQYPLVLMVFTEQLFRYPAAGLLQRIQHKGAALEWTVPLKVAMLITLATCLLH